MFISESIFVLHLHDASKYKYLPVKFNNHACKTGHTLQLCSICLRESLVSLIHRGFKTRRGLITGFQVDHSAVLWWLKLREQKSFPLAQRLLKLKVDFDSTLVQFALHPAAPAASPPLLRVSACFEGTEKNKKRRRAATSGEHHPIRRLPKNWAISDSLRSPLRLLPAAVATLRNQRGFCPADGSHAPVKLLTCPEVSEESEPSDGGDDLSRCRNYSQQRTGCRCRQRLITPAGLRQQHRMRLKPQKFNDCPRPAPWLHQVVN